MSGYNSTVASNGAALDNLLKKIKTATAATASAAGGEGLIPGPPAGSNTTKKVLLSDITWGEYVKGSDITSAVNTAKTELNGNITSSVNAAKTELNGNINTAKTELNTKITAVENKIPSVDATAMAYATFMSKAVKTVTTLASLPTDAHNIIANVTAATNLSVASGLVAGRDIQIRVNNTTSSVITQTIPTTGSYQCLDGTSVEIPANSFIELNIWYINDKYVIRIGQNQ